MSSRPLYDNQGRFIGTTEGPVPNGGQVTVNIPGGGTVTGNGGANGEVFIPNIWPSKSSIWDWNGDTRA